MFTLTRGRYLNELNEFYVNIAAQITVYYEDDEKSYNYFYQYTKVVNIEYLNGV